MKTAGKWYLWLNQAATVNIFWSDILGDWTRDPKQASFYREMWEVEAAVARAEMTTECEVMTRRATKDIPG